jgi:hypothetical protein
MNTDGEEEGEPSFPFSLYLCESCPAEILNQSIATDVTDEHRLRQTAIGENRCHRWQLSISAEQDAHR